MAKAKSVVTPRGIAMYPWLTKPDTKFDAGGVYKMSLSLPSDEQTTQELCEKIRETFTEEMGSKKLAKANFPFKEDGEGNTVFSFKSKQRPKIYNAKGQIIPNPDSLKIGGGSTVKVNCSMTAYDKGINTGVVLYLNGVQVIELVEFASGSTAFGDEGGSFVSGGDDAPNVESDDDEDHPF